MVVSPGDFFASRDLEPFLKQRSIDHQGVVLSGLAAGRYSFVEAGQVGQERSIDPSAEHGRPEQVFFYGDDHRFEPGIDKLFHQLCLVFQP